MRAKRAGLPRTDRLRLPARAMFFERPEHHSERAGEILADRGTRSPDPASS